MPGSTETDPTLYENHGTGMDLLWVTSIYKLQIIQCSVSYCCKHANIEKFMPKMTNQQHTDKLV